MKTIKAVMTTQVENKELKGISVDLKKLDITPDDDNIEVHITHESKGDEYSLSELLDIILVMEEDENTFESFRLNENTNIKLSENSFIYHPRKDIEKYNLFFSDHSPGGPLHWIEISNLPF